MKLISALNEEKRFAAVKKGDKSVSVDDDTGVVVAKGPALVLAKKYDKHMAANLDDFGFDKDSEAIAVKDDNDGKIYVWGYGSGLGA